MRKYQNLFHKEIVMDDILKLVEKPVRKISKFDTKVIDEKIRGIEDGIKDVKDKLEHLTKYTIDWFKALKKKYGKDFPRLTEISSFGSIAASKVVNNNAKLYVNKAEGFAGTNLKKEDGVEYVCDCSDISEIIVINRQGQYMVKKVSEKEFFCKDLLYVNVFSRGDSRTIYNVIYREGKSSVYYAKRFNITSVTRDKWYDITTGVPGSVIQWFTANHNGEAESVKIYLKAKTKLKKLSLEYDFSTLSIKGKSSRGNLVTKNPVSKIQLKSKGASTIGGKDIWYDPDIQSLNEDGRGQYLGQFESQDKILAIFRNGTCYTTSFDLSNKYQGDVLKIEKYDANKVYTALYWDSSVKAFYIKRFVFPLSENTPLLFIAEGRNSYLVELSDDRHPRFLISFGGKNEGREAESVEADSFIMVKGIGAKGKKCHGLDVKKVEFIEPLVKPEDDMAEKESAGGENLAGEIDADEELIDPMDIEIPDVDMSKVEVPEIKEDDQLTLF